MLPFHREACGSAVPRPLTMPRNVAAQSYTLCTASIPGGADPHRRTMRQLITTTP